MVPKWFFVKLLWVQSVGCWRRVRELPAAGFWYLARDTDFGAVKDKSVGQNRYEVCDYEQ
jgi:hypothetical protein